MQTGASNMKATERIIRHNHRRTRGVARKIIEEHDLHPELFTDDDVVGRTVYQDLIDYVWPTVVTLTPRVLGEIASSGKGQPAKRIGTRVPDPPSGTTFMDVNGSTQFWIQAHWDGLAILRVIAASAIIAKNPSLPLAGCNISTIAPALGRVSAGPQSA